jgi:type VI secretion system secreted protein Hcp
MLGSKTRNNAIYPKESNSTGDIMAIDAYMEITDIKGESTDDKHKAWIECLDVEFGVDQPRSPVASTSGGHTSARAEFDEVVVTKLTDLSTPLLLQHCAMGKTIPKAKFEFFRADGNGERVKYFEMVLENVLIGSVKPGIKPGGGMQEHLCLKFAKVTWKYTQQKISGGVGGSTMGGWDLSANKVYA